MRACLQMPAGQCCSMAEIQLEIPKSDDVSCTLGVDLQEDLKTMQLCGDDVLEQFIKFVRNFGGEWLFVTTLPVTNTDSVY